MTRIIPLQGVRNFRDFGGWTAGEGARVRRGRLFRSGHFSGATPEDWRALEPLSIEAVADLRRSTERARDPSDWPADWRVEVIASDDAHLGEAPHIRFLTETETITEDATRGYMMGSYRRIPFEPGHQAVFKTFMRRAAEGRRVVAHCAAGKDRTGVLCALTLSALGVPQDQVIEDYLMTNEAVELDKVLPTIAKRMNAALNLRAEPQALAPMIGVQPDFLDSAFDEIESRSGSVDAYLDSELGLTDERREALRKALLEPDV